MKDKKTFADSIDPNSAAGESFADLFQEREVRPLRLKPGQKVTATVVGMNEEYLFLDIGGKSEGCLLKSEVVDNEGVCTVAVGDTITPYFLSSKNQEMLFTTRVGSGAAALEHLEEAYASSIPVEGVVKQEVKGGFEVMIGGRTRGFCPYSQMGLRRVEDASAFIEQTLPFKITELSQGGRNIVLSHRAVLLEEREARKAELQLSLKEGDLVTGTITSLQKFGAFVEVDCIEGLIPISEIGWGRVEEVADILSPGQEVEVTVLKLDWQADRFSFSLKAALPNPWEQVESRYLKGSRHTGKVVRLMNFGAFVALEPGVEGLVHISKMAKGKKIGHPREVVAEGQNVEVMIDGVDMAKKQISLALVLAEAAGEEPTAAEPEEDYRHYMPRAKAGSAKSGATLGDLLQAAQQKKAKKR